jgi:hypothetical protein
MYAVETSNRQVQVLDLSKIKLYSHAAITPLQLGSWYERVVFAVVSPAAYFHLPPKHAYTQVTQDSYGQKEEEGTVDEQRPKIITMRKKNTLETRRDEKEERELQGSYSYIG